MPRTIRFHLDENCPKAVADGLRRRGIEVSATPGVGLLAATDDEQLEYARVEGRVIFTQYQDFLRLQAAGSPHAGIVFVEKNRTSVGEMLSGLILIWEFCEPNEMVGRIEFL